MTASLPDPALGFVLELLVLGSEVPFGIIALGFWPCASVASGHGTVQTKLQWRNLNFPHMVELSQQECK